LMGFSILLSCVFALWLISVRIRDVSIVDSFWSLGFLIVSLVSYFHPETSGGFEGRKKLILITTATWALRLSMYLTWRNHGAGEDPRYRAMRRAFGPKFWWLSLFQTFFLQAVLCFVIAQPLHVGQKGPDAEGGVSGPNRRFTFFDGLGAAVWLLGFFFETVGDFQLARFKADPANKGKLLTSGLWRYTRHPNYFGNAAIFWGFWLMACSVDGGWRTFYSPLLMTFLLLKVSGVALLERSLIKTKPGYENYIASTSSFFPTFW